MGRTRLEQLMELTGSWGRDPTLEHRRSVRNPSPEEEGTAETWDELCTAPIPHPPVQCRGGAGEFGTEIESVEKGVEGEGVLQFSFCFSLSYSEWICNKLISPN